MLGKRLLKEFNFYGGGETRERGEGSRRGEEEKGRDRPPNANS